MRLVLITFKHKKKPFNLDTNTSLWSNPSHGCGGCGHINILNFYSGRYIGGISFYTSFDRPPGWSASVMVNTSVSGDLPRTVRVRDFRAVF